MIISKLFSRGCMAWGLVLRRGFHGEISLLSGFTLNASCGFTRFLLRKEFPNVVFVFLSLACSTLLFSSFRFRTPVYSSRHVSVFSKRESMISTTPRQLLSTSSTSSRIGAFRSAIDVADCSNALDKASTRAACSSSALPSW